MKNILVVDDDTTFCLILKTFLEKKGFFVKEAFSFSDAKKSIQSRSYDIVLTDLRLPEQDGIVLLKEVKSLSPHTQVILMTGYADIKSAVQSIKLGAFDYVAKPVNPDEIYHTIKDALHHNGKTEKTSSRKENTSFVRGISKEAFEMHEYVTLVAPTNMSVLIIGESGTGKEYIAKLIHEESKRNNKPFVAIDCGALPKELAASEFFGHVKGSFTGAIVHKTGQFELANGGTLFLDEVGNLSYDIQVQLLRAIQEKKIRPVGNDKEIDVNLRLIAATNEDLSLAVKKGDFREDLFHRLNEFSIYVPGLQDRKADLMIFANHFLEQSNHELERNIKGFEEEVTEVFKKYAWPGNIRELKNVVKRAVLLCTGNRLSLKELPAELIHSGQYPVNEMDDLKKIKEMTEYEQIIHVLKKVNYNKSKAARMLNIDRKTLYNKLKHYHIPLDKENSPE